MKRKFCMAALQLVTVPAFSQIKQTEVVAAAGGFGEKDGYSASFTIGEAVTGTLKSSDGSLIVVQGFQQGYIAAQEQVDPPVTGLEEFSAANLTVYPNPVRTIAFVELTNTDAEGCVVKCFDMAGRVLSEDTFGEDTRLPIDMSALPQGAYLIRVVSKEGIVVNKKIMKY